MRRLISILLIGLVIASGCASLETKPPAPPTNIPDNKQAEADYWYNKGIIFLKDRNFQGAVEAFDKSRELNPSNAAVYSDLGIIYDLLLDNPSKAIFYYSKYLELAPADAPDREKVPRWIEGCRKRIQNPSKR